MACLACGDVDQPCCANNACTKGICQNNVCKTSGIWGYPCNTDGTCGKGLSCNTMVAAGGICQNQVSGSPNYGSSCFDDTYCKSQGGPLSCIADLVTSTSTSGHFTRCGCSTAGANCGKDDKGHSRVCADPSSTQSWEALTAP